MSLILIANYLIVFVIGFAYSFIELLSKYKDGSHIFQVSAGWIYMLLNGVISATAYYILNQWNIKVDEQNISEATKMIIAGVSAMVIIRSSIFSIKIVNSEIKKEVTPFIQVLLDWVNKKFDQKRAGLRLKEVKEIMKNVDFEKAELILPDLCITHMKTITYDDQKIIGAKVEEIKKLINLENSKIDANFVKTLKLGMLLADTAGIGILKDAVEVLKNDISKS